MAVIVNRRLIVRPSVFLGLISLLVLEAFVNALQARHFGTIYRSFRLGGFVFALWLLSPWWGRRDLLLVRSHVITTTVVLGFTVLGLIVSPSQALGGGRLGGAFWPTPPPQVAEFAAVTLGLVVVMWLAARFSGWGTLFVTGIAVLILYLSHTRTAILAMVLGVFVAGLSMISNRSPGTEAVRLDRHHRHDRRRDAVRGGDDMAAARRRHPAADQPHRPDGHLVGGRQHPAQPVPGDLRLRPVEQIGQRPAGRQ